MKYNETCRTLTKCFEEIESLVAIVLERLHDIDIPVKAIMIEYWPEFINDRLSYKIWSGVEHIVPAYGDCAIPSMLAANDIIDIVKRKEILMRKFS